MDTTTSKIKYKGLVEYHPKFDMIRGIAAIVVLFAHICQTFVWRFYHKGDLIQYIMGTLARHAVLVFFLLSGYLITSSIVTNVHRNGLFDWVSYLIARVTRIYPPLFGSILIVIFCWSIIHILGLPGKISYGIATDTTVVRDSFAFHFRDIIYALAMKNGMIQADGPLWSLNLEFIIYIVAIFGAFLITSTKWLFKIAWIIPIILITVYGIKINPEFLLYEFVWLAGSVTALVKSIGAEKKVKAPLFILSSISFIFLFLIGILDPDSLSGLEKNLFIQYSVQIITCICYLYMIFFSSVLERNYSKVVLASGGYSYSLYIIHFPLLLLLYSFTQNWMGASHFKTAIVCVFAIFQSILFAWGFSKYFENQRLFKPYVASCFNLLRVLKFENITKK